MMRALVFALVAAAGCAKSGGSGHTETKSSPGNAATVSQSQSQTTASIGSATMQADGTIVLRLRATDGTRMLNDIRLTYRPADHRQYAEILAHLGGLEPGEEKPVVPPWPE